jgi:hypothetical protein
VCEWLRWIAAFAKTVSGKLLNETPADSKESVLHVRTHSFYFGQSLLKCLQQSSIFSVANAGNGHVGNTRIEGRVDSFIDLYCSSHPLHSRFCRSVLALWYLSSGPTALRTESQAWPVGVCDQSTAVLAVDGSGLVVENVGQSPKVQNTQAFVLAQQYATIAALLQTVERHW